MNRKTFRKLFFATCLAIINLAILIIICLIITVLLEIIKPQENSMLHELGTIIAQVSYLQFALTYIVSYVVTLMILGLLFLMDKSANLVFVNRKSIFRRTWSSQQINYFANATVLIPFLLTLMTLFNSKVITSLIFPITFFITGQSFLTLFEDSNDNTQKRPRKDTSRNKQSQ